MPGVCSLSRPGARWRRAQAGVPQCGRPALPLMLLLQLQPPVPHGPDTSSESQQMACPDGAQGVSLGHSVVTHSMQSLRIFQYLECAQA